MPWPRKIHLLFLTRLKREGREREREKRKGEKEGGRKEEEGGGGKQERREGEEMSNEGGRVRKGRRKKPSIVAINFPSTVSSSPLAAVEKKGKKNVRKE